MTTTGREHSILPARNLLSPGFFWAILRLPEMFAASLAATAVALTLARAIPQQPAEFSTPGEFVIWVSNLPPFFQQTFQPLNGLGLFKIYHTPWFWFPVAWLTLTGLISLADQLPAAWQRLRPAAGAVLLPHPLSRYRRQTIRLAAPQHASEGTSVEAPLAALQAKLVANGYRIVPSQPGQTVTAGRRVWRWSGPALQVTGILLVIAGVVVQSLWGQVEEKSLPLAAAAAPTGIAGQEVRLKTFDPVPDTTGNLLGGAVAVKLQDGPTVVWQLYRPYRLNGWWVIPTTAGAVAHVSFVQGQTVQKLDLAFGNPAKPARFVHSPANLTFELRYRATYRGPAYRLRVIDGPDGGPGDVKVQQQGHTFLVEGANLRGEVAVDDRLRLRAYHLPGLAPLAMGGLLFLLGAVQGVWPPPGIIRLAVVTKGRGSRIEAEIESLDDEPITGEMSLLNFEAGDDERTD